MRDAQLIADEYVALWNQRDPGLRRGVITSLWSVEGWHYVKTLRIQGYDALEARVTGSHEKNVRDAGYVFRACQNAQRLPGVITFNWEMVNPAAGTILATGLEFLEVDADDRIVRDFQFIVTS